MLCTTVEVVVAAHWVVSESVYHLCQDVESVCHLPHHQETTVSQTKEGVSILYTHSSVQQHVHGNSFFSHVKKGEKKEREKGELLRGFTTNACI